MDNQQIHFTISLAQGNLILLALAERPFKQVVELIAHLNQQAARLFAQDADGEQLGRFSVSPGQLRVILDALGDVPYNRVNRLLQQLHQQLQEACERD